MPESAFDRASRIADAILGETTSSENTALIAIFMSIATDLHALVEQGTP